MVLHSEARPKTVLLPARSASRPEENFWHLGKSGYPVRAAKLLVNNIPRPDLEEFDLKWAVGVWQTPSSYQIEEIRDALSIARYWHADRSDLLRRAVKGSELYNDIKADEELLEVYITDLKDALWVAAHVNKMANGGL